MQAKFYCSARAVIRYAGEAYWAQVFQMYYDDNRFAIAGC
jgi:hypothetical protein